MFTGLVEECGEVRASDLSAAGTQLIVRAPIVARDIRVGDSVAVNGCCLTVANHQAEDLGFDLLRETLDRTNLGRLTPGARVNLERALLAGGRLGGHFVQGHIDCTARVVSLAPTGADYRLEVQLPPEFAKYVAYKGSIAIDGISLTIAEVRPDSFVVWIIPHTLSATNLPDRKPHDPVNLEFDLLAKYVERIVAAR